MKTVRSMTRNAKVLWVSGAVLFLLIGGLVYVSAQTILVSYQFNQTQQELDGLNNTLTNDNFDKGELQDNLLAVEQIATLVDPEIDQNESEIEASANTIDPQLDFNNAVLDLSDL